MTRITKSAIVQYSDQAMFDLVKDIQHYADFLPWCSGSSILLETPTEVTGQLEISHLGMQQSFSTRNRLQPPAQMTLELEDGPFDTFHGDWTFQALGEDACKVSLVLEFKFSNFLIGAAFGSTFEQIANTLVDSFCQRAKVVYGE